ncbi:MAG TPA: hypothetical protein VL096_08375, partial [Pirellulaceae bacterium]|nr:hypothetical protein [Pirellulaceae bacterium]
MKISRDGGSIPPASTHEPLAITVASGFFYCTFGDLQCDTFLVRNGPVSDFLPFEFLIFGCGVSDFLDNLDIQKQASTLRLETFMTEKKALRADSKGYFYRNLGWLPQASGSKPTQPKFLLGKDRGQAEARLARLETMWGLVETGFIEEYGTSELPTWDKVTLEIG